MLFVTSLTRDTLLGNNYSMCVGVCVLIGWEFSPKEKNIVTLLPLAELYSNYADQHAHWKIPAADVHKNPYLACCLSVLSLLQLA